MAEPQIVVPDFRGYHNTNPQTEERLRKARTYQDLSTIIICPTRGSIPAKVVQSWMGMMRPMNQMVIGPLFAIGMEVGAAYSGMISNILADPNLSKFKYILTIEEDNCPPPDGLMKLYENIDKYDVVAGLYFTKGEGGQPMLYGNPKVHPKNFIPQLPIPEAIQEVNGLGMGFNLFKLDMFKDERLRKPWFKTEQSYDPVAGGKSYTQDLWFYEDAAKWGYKFACDNRVRVGHYDLASDMIW